MASPARVLHPLVPVFAGVVVLALNFWGIAPFTRGVFSEATSNVLYLLVRLVTFAAVAAWLKVSTDRRPIQIVSLVTICAFFDQVLFKFGLLLDPSRNGGMRGVEIWVSLMMSYLLFLPLVLVLGYVGTEIGSWVRNKKK